MDADKIERIQQEVQRVVSEQKYDFSDPESRFELPVGMLKIPVTQKVNEPNIQFVYDEKGKIVGAEIEVIQPRIVIDFEIRPL
jgi:hypothetical protein